jgi:hypothetical protein
VLQLIVNIKLLKMKKGLTIIAVLLFLTSCEDAKDAFVLGGPIGKVNKVLVVTTGDHWKGAIGNELRDFLGKLVVGLPQPETTFSVSQVAPKGFGSIMNKSRNILLVQIAKKESFRVQENRFASPQRIISITAKDEAGLIAQLKKYKKEIVKTFRDGDLNTMQNAFNKKRVDDSKYETLKKLGLSLIIPREYRTVDDTGEFLWLRQHLLSGIARGDGTNNILVYSVPLTEEFDLDASNNILINRNRIGEKYIPGSKEGMYMITEAAFTPETKTTKVANKDAFETRGKWEVKDDFMAGPFLNYTVIDKENNRLIIVEGFTYAPSVNKRQFVFELEAIAKSLKFL